MVTPRPTPPQRLMLSSVSLYQSLSQSVHRLSCYHRFYLIFFANVFLFYEILATIGAKAARRVLGINKQIQLHEVYWVPNNPC